MLINSFKKQGRNMNTSTFGLQHQNITPCPSLSLPIPLYPSLSLSIPLYPSLFLPILLYSSLFLSTPPYPSLSLSIPLYSLIIRYIPCELVIYDFPIDHTLLIVIYLKGV
jgi:hypothetical protein